MLKGGCFDILSIYWHFIVLRVTDITHAAANSGSPTYNSTETHGVLYIVIIIQFNLWINL